MCKKDRLIRQLQEDYAKMKARRQQAVKEAWRLKHVVSELQERLADQEDVVQAAFWYFTDTEDTEPMAKRKALHNAVKRWFAGTKPSDIGTLQEKPDD